VLSRCNGQRPSGKRLLLDGLIRGLVLVATGRIVAVRCFGCAAIEVSLDLLLVLDGDLQARHGFGYRRKRNACVRGDLLLRGGGNGGFEAVGEVGVSGGRWRW